MSVRPGGAPLLPASRTPASAGPVSAADEPIEFIHIGKNAGGSIETTGTRLGLHWGQQRLWPELDEKTMPCVRTNLLGGVFEGHSWHHVPRCFWARQGLHPFSGNKTSFCVVRHPYTRAVSAFGWRHHNVPLEDFCSARELNKYVQRRLTAQLSRLNATAACELTQEQGVDDCHWLPQWIYLPCDNILHYESLRAEFDELISNYSARQLLNVSRYARSLPESLLARPEESILAKAVHRHTCNLTAAALDARSRALLDEVYARDFAVLGYDNSRIQTFSAGVQLRERWRFVDWGASVMDTEWV